MADFTNIRNFKPEEFDEPGMMSQALVDLLDKLRDSVGMPLTINSSFREAGKNKSVGGVVDSQHLLGKAVDIAVSDGLEAFKVVSCAIRLGFTGIGVKRVSGGAGFVHLDTREGLPVLWTYA